MKIKPKQFTQPKPESRLEKIEHKKLKKTIKTAKISFYLVATLLVVLGALSVYDYVNTHSFRSPVIINFQSPVVKTETKIVSPLSKKVVKEAHAEEVKIEDMNDEEYIRHKFGKQGDIAVAIAKAESGLRADAVNPNNDNGTIDIGCWQVNSIHLKKGTITIAELLDCRKATDWVYENLYMHSGFNPWVAYTTGSYLNMM